MGGVEHTISIWDMYHIDMFSKWSPFNREVKQKQQQQECYMKNLFLNIYITRYICIKIVG